MHSQKSYSNSIKKAIKTVVGIVAYRVNQDPRTIIHITDGSSA